MDASMWKYSWFILLLAFLISLPKRLDQWLQPNFPVHTTGSVLISGTSSGIGRATCAYLATEHPQIKFYCGVRKLSNETVHPFSLPNVQPILLDVTNSTQIDQALQTVQPPLIGIFANAGIVVKGTVEFVSILDIAKQFDVNIFGTLRLTQAALPQIRQHQGRVIWMSSASGLMPGEIRWGPYLASKAAIEKLGDSLRKELDPLGVSVSLIEPGYIPTEMTRSISGIFGAILEGSQSPTQEQQIYPEAFDGAWVNAHKKVLDFGTFSVDETCEAIEHALFSKYPQTRYMTAGFGPMPTWIFLIFVYLLPGDRFRHLVLSSPLFLRFGMSVRILYDQLRPWIPF